MFLLIQVSLKIIITVIYELNYTLVCKMWDFHGAKQGGFPVSFCFALDHQYPLRIIALIYSEVFNFCLIFVAQIVKSQAVFFFVHYGAQLVLKHLCLCSIKQTFKHRILYSLPIVYTLLCNQPQPSPACRVFGIYVVCYKYKQ